MRARLPPWAPWLGAGSVLFLAMAGVIFERGKTAKTVPSASAGSTERNVPASKRKIARRVPPPVADLEGKDHSRREKLQALLQNFLESTRYPPTSRPLAEQPSNRDPHRPPPVMRATDGDHGRKVEVRETQDRQYVAEGETAVARIEVSVDGQPALEMSSAGASLAKVEGKPPAANPVASVDFRDDGAAPDERAKDGKLAAAIPFTAATMGTFVGDAQVTANLRVGETTVASVFGFVYTGPPPARFTGKIREAIEDGSLALYAGVQVERDGEYVVRGRLYDADGEPVALLDASGGLLRSMEEIRFLAYGCLLRDWGVNSPFELRDVEAWRVDNGYPDRQKVPTWTGPYRTRAYAADDFSDREWTSPEKDRQLATLKERLANEVP